MSFIDVEEVRQHLDTSLEEEALGLLIDAEEARLTRRIGPLDGEVVEVFTPDPYERVVLTRPTAEVEVDDNGSVAVVTLRRDGRTLVPDADYWNGDVSVTYTPNDEQEVRGVLVELLRLRVTETGYTSENTDSYRYQNDANVRARRREGLIRSLLPKQLPASLRITSSVET